MRVCEALAERGGPRAQVNTLAMRVRYIVGVCKNDSFQVRVNLSTMRTDLLSYERLDEDATNMMDSDYIGTYYFLLATSGVIYYMTAGCGLPLVNRSK